MVVTSVPFTEAVVVAVLLVLDLVLAWRWQRTTREVEQGRTAYWHLMATARCALCGSQMELPVAAAATLLPSPYDGPTEMR